MVTIVRNALRFSINPILENGDVKLFRDEVHLQGQPFIGLEDNHFLFDKYKRDQFRHFSDASGIEVVGSWDKEYEAGESLEGFYEASRNIKTGHRHLNYLLNAEFEKETKPKMSFSFFRKKAEPIAFSFNDTFSSKKTEATSYLENYFSHKYASQYFETRNKLHGHHFSTGFSKYLNLGQLHPFEIVKAVNQYEKVNGSNKSTYWIKVELLWREYFYWLYVEHGCDFFRSRGLDGGDFHLDKIDLSKYLEAMNANPLIEAMNKELMNEGTLSNRSRQIYASYLINCTDLDWRYGAWFFQLFLIDYDLYSNWGNWLYLSGWGTDSRGPRFFNIVKQMKNYDPQLSYLNKYNPGIKDPWEAIRND